MPVSLDKLVDIINNKIVAGGQDVIDLARLYGSTQALSEIYSVANTASLPAASDNTGRFIYVEDIGAYRYSDGTQWTNDYDTTQSTISTQLWAWGCNANGSLGDGTVTNRCSPVREFCSATDWCQVSAGRFHVAAIKTSGELWSWGNGNYGALGNGLTSQSCSAVRELCSGTNWCFVSVTCDRSIAIKTSGELWSWGINTSGQLGDSTNTARCSPVREISSSTDWCQVSAGSAHTVAIKTSGQLWAWGGNSCGTLGDGTTTQRLSPVREICSATDWCQVSNGSFFSGAIKASGELWSWGRNFCGVLGDGAVAETCSPVREFCSATNWCFLDHGTNHSLAIKTSGELWGWGRPSSDFLLGDGTATSKCSPVREICSATDWCQVAPGNDHSTAIKTTGQIWAWGDNRAGQLGDGTTSKRCSPVREITSATDWCLVSAGYCHTAAIKATVVRGFNEP